MAYISRSPMPPRRKPRHRPGLAALRLAGLAVLLLAITGCSLTLGERSETAATTTTFIVVRHAEKVDASRDPDLSPAGLARAQALAEWLDGRDLVAIYATEFKRTGQTVAPTAVAHALPVTAYPSAQPAAEFATALKAAHPRGVVLIAGHSNTVPGIVAALCNCETAPMTDQEYDRLSTIHLDASGRARLDSTRYGAASPAP
jgi:broad specificity phosphatase PhoE